VSKLNPKVVMLVYDPRSVHVVNNVCTYELPVAIRCADTDAEWKKAAKELCEYPDQHIVLSVHNNTESGGATAMTVEGLKFSLRDDKP